MNYKIVSIALAGVALGLFVILSDAQDSSDSSPKQITTKTAAPSVSADITKITTAKTFNATSIRTSNPKAETVAITNSPIERIKAIQQKTALHTALIKDHDNFTRYPGFNRRFSDQSNDPVSKRYEIDERTTQSEEDHLALTIWSDKKFYAHGDEVTVYAMLQDENGTRLPTKFAGQLIFNERQELSVFDFEDTDQDGLYEVSFALKDGQNTFSPGAYKLLVVNQANDLNDAVVFVLSEPNAALTGNYRDRLTSDGNLLIEAELDVSESNRYSLEATLYSSTNDAIGQTQFAMNLTPGKHWIPLTFFGLMMHDASEPGPYLLKNVSLAKVVMPMERAPLIEPDFYTQAYSLEDFSTTRYQ